MKKTLSRTLSLLLVLAMVLTFVPMSLAATGDGGSVTVSPSSSTVKLEDGKANATFNATVTAPEGYKVKEYNWAVTPAGATGTAGGGGIVYTVNFESAGKYTVGVNVVFEAEAEDALLKTVSQDGSATVTVEEEEVVVLNKVTLSGKNEVQVGKTIDLDYVTDPADYKPTADVKWESSDDDVATVDKNGTVTGVSKGTAVISVNVDGKIDSTKVTVTNAETTVTVSDEITVAVDKTAEIEVKIDPEEAGEDAKITYTSASSSIASVSSKGVVTGEKVGNTKIYVKVTNVDDFEDTTFTVPVTVTKETLTCDYKTTSAKSGTETVTLKPSYSGSTKDVTYTFTKTDSYGTISVDKDTGVVTANGVAAIRVKVEAWDKEGKSLGTCYSGASFYEYNDVSVTMPDGNTTLTFGTNADIEESGNLNSKLISNYPGSSKDRFYVTNLDTAEGTLSGTGWTSGDGYTLVANIGKLKFTVGTKGSAAFDYEMVYSGYTELPLRKGEVKIDYDGEVGRIEFSGSYDSSLTLGETNFEKFWKACKMSGDLDYIKLNTLPSSTYGTFYTSKTNKTSSYAAKTSYEFYDDYTSSDAKNNSNAMDLDLLTFVPVSTKKDTYDVVVSFTAYGEKSGEEVTGNIVIHMNEATNDITSRGIFFGTQYDTKNKLTYADKIADAFEDATDEDLSYVIFTLPEAEQAHLYLEIPSSSSGNTLVAQGEHLSSKTKLYYDTDNKKVDWLEDAALIPAAGFSGKITLSYTAYSEDGETSKEGTITFNVTAKTKSAVFSDVSTSYSWAADSVDFLYYEGTAQGANGKYNPTNNITRGDFMLMLYRAFLEDEYSTYNVTSNFTDVVKGTTDYSKETYQAVGVAKYLGIAQGSNNKFNPKTSITREEAMTLIQRTLDKVGRTLDYSTSTKASSFTDYSSISSYAKTSIDSLVKSGVIVGNNNKINPKSYITRAEMACILHRVITY
jgi:hypothetical protein